MNTEKDPTGKSQHELGAKLDAGKPLAWLCLSGFAHALRAVVEVTTKGATKYTPNGWRTVPDGQTRYMEAFSRHMLALAGGEEFDSDTGCKHKAQMIWNLLASLELELAAEKVANQLVQPEQTCQLNHTASDLLPSHEENATKFFGQMTTAEPVRPTPHSTPAQVAELERTNQALAEELGKCQHWAGVQSQELKHLEAKAMAAHEAYMQALEHNRSLEVQLDTTHSALADFVCRFDLTKEYMTKEQVLAGQAKHEAQVEKLRERECLDIETINDLRTELASCIAANESMTAKFQAERKANVAMHEEVTRLRGKVQELADIANYRDKRNAELCAELESLRGSHTALAKASQEFKDELAASTRAMLNAQDELESHKLQLDRLRTELHGAEIINVGIRNSLQISEQAAETQRGKCIAQSSRISELQTLVDNLRSSLAQATKEASCAHNTDEPKAAPRPAYVDPFDQYGDIRSPMHRLVGSLDPARGGLAYPQGKDAPTPL